MEGRFGVGWGGVIGYYMNVRIGVRVRVRVRVGVTNPQSIRH